MAASPRILVTGASSGIGRATALFLAARGFHVLGTVRRAEDGQALEKDGGGAVEALRLDVTDPDSIAALAAAVTARCATTGLAGLVNNAGIVVSAPLEVLPLARFRHQLEVNLTGVLAVTQALLPLLRRARGRIVNIGSVSGLVTWPVEGAYSVSKYGLEALSDALRQELAPWGVRVVLVEPGPVRTPIWERSARRGAAIARALPAEDRARYEPLYRAVQQAADSSAARGIAPETVAAAIHRALTARRPPARILPGFRSRWETRILRLLPHRLRDALTLRHLRWTSPPR